jgi:hypothetical protein
MTLESKAKTTRQVIDSSLGTENWDLNGSGITEVKLDFEKPAWVPLEEVKAQENKAEAAYDKACQTANDYCLKVCEFLTFLENLKNSAQPQSIMWQAGFSHAFDNCERRFKELFPNHVAFKET